MSALNPLASSLAKDRTTDGPTKDSIFASEKALIECKVKTIPRNVDVMKIMGIDFIPQNSISLYKRENLNGGFAISFRIVPENEKIPKTSFMIDLKIPIKYL
jgi:hypothetical protein